MNYKELSSGEGARGNRGFTLVQALVSASIIGILAATAASQLTGTKVSAELVKMQNDVRSLNSAIRIYRTFGGNLDSVTSAHEVLQKLQTKADSSSAARTAGLTGSLVDSRLQVEYQSKTDAKSAKPRALWDAELRRFVIAKEGERGVARFYVSHAVSQTGEGTTPGESVATEHREQNLDLNADDGWIWAFNEGAHPDGTILTEVTLADDSGTAGTGGTGGSGGTGTGGGPVHTLRPPVFTIPGSTFLISYFDIMTTLGNPNSGGSSRILYKIGSGAWAEYTSGAFFVAPGQTITAKAESLDASIWADSVLALETFTAQPMTMTAPVILTSAIAFDHGANANILLTVYSDNDDAYATTEYRVNGGPWQVYLTPFSLD